MRWDTVGRCGDGSEGGGDGYSGSGDGDGDDGFGDGSGDLDDDRGTRYGRRDTVGSCDRNTGYGGRADDGT